MILLMILLIAVVVGFAFWSIQAYVRYAAHHVPSRFVDPAEGALAEAYAHGEIDAKEYWRRLELLRSRPL